VGWSLVVGYMGVGGWLVERERRWGGGYEAGWREEVVNTADGASGCPARF